MTSLESIERLRDCTWIGGGKVNEYLDEIEREIAEKYIELPVDADGVPIRIGDVVEFGENRNQGIVKALNEHMVIAMHVDCDYTNYAKYGLLWNADACRHVKPRTVEDVLREFGKAYTFVDGECANTHTLVATYANELRELLGGDGE